MQASPGLALGSAVLAWEVLQRLPGQRSGGPGEVHSPPPNFVGDSVLPWEEGPPSHRVPSEDDESHTVTVTSG